ncbi:MAG: hypothetical protein JW884_10465 [Deltaproteobacteria bacterium]|nr:hypothetical protein [Deltaproteobacteria bacterium]
MHLSETVQIILGIIGMIAMFLASRSIMGILHRRAVYTVIGELKKKAAFDNETAVLLGYANKGLINFGLRDYRPAALKHLIKEGAIVKTSQGTFHLAQRYEKILKDMEQRGYRPDIAG